MSLADEVRDGSLARRALDDPAIQKAFSDVEAAITQRWAVCPLRDKDGQYELRLMLKLLGDVRANLEQAVNAGKLAATELEITQEREKQSLFSRLKRAR